jgi:acetyl esterase/lipase
MSFFNRIFGFLKKLTIFIVIVSIAIPLYYGSTNRQYLQVRLFHSILSLKHAFISDQARPTLSAGYRAFEDIMRAIPLGQVDPTIDILTSIEKMRLSFTMNNTIPKPSQCQVHKEVFHHDGHSVDTYWVDYPDRKFQRTSDKILIYLHGGGYIIGDIHGKLYLLCSNKIIHFL